MLGLIHLKDTATMHLDQDQHLAGNVQENMQHSLVEKRYRYRYYDTNMNMNLNDLNLYDSGST